MGALLWKAQEKNFEKEDESVLHRRTFTGDEFDKARAGVGRHSKCNLLKNATDKRAC